MMGNVGSTYIANKNDKFLSKSADQGVVFPLGTCYNQPIHALMEKSNREACPSREAAPSAESAPGQIAVKFPPEHPR